MYNLMACTRPINGPSQQFSGQLAKPDAFLIPHNFHPKLFYPFMRMALTKTRWNELVSAQIVMRQVKDKSSSNCAITPIVN